jgi:pyruvate/2-oxoglutarate dehydrogenase complex dihydrolipoamide dehydrogenase (E3) component
VSAGIVSLQFKHLCFAELFSPTISFLFFRFLRGTLPQRIDKLENGQLRVTFSNGIESSTEDFDTVLYAVGREPCTRQLNLGAAGVEVDPKTLKIPVDSEERTNVPHIYAIGDVMQSKNSAVSNIELIWFYMCVLLIKFAFIFGNS